MSDTPEISTPEAPTKSPGALLADDLYGKPAEKPVEQVAEPGTPEQPENPETETPEAAPESETEEVELSTVSELAEHFELDPDWLKTLKLTEKVNGKPVEFTIADAVTTHQQVKAGDAYLADAKQKAKAIIEEAARQGQSLNAHIATFSKLVETMEAEITKDVKSKDLAKLREDDPAEYAAYMEEIRSRRERLKEIKQEAQQAFQKAAQDAMENQRAALDQRLPQEWELFLERVPEWSDEEKAAAEKAEVVKYLIGEGFTEQDINIAAYNGRVLALAVKAMRWDAAKSKSEVTKKKVIKVPKVLKPGSKSKEQPKPNGAQKNDPVSILYG